MVFWGCFVGHKEQELTSVDTGSPSLTHLLRICLSRGSRQGWSFCLQWVLLSFQASFGIRTNPFAFPSLRSTLSEASQVYLFPEPLPSPPLLSVQEPPVPQLLSGSHCTAEPLCVCCLMVQTLKPTWLPFLSCSDTLQLDKDAFLQLFFLVFSSKFAFHADFSCYFLFPIFLTNLTLLAPT